MQTSASFVGTGPRKGVRKDVKRIVNLYSNTLVSKEHVKGEEACCNRTSVALDPLSLASISLRI
jgi:hypothetical protein